METIEKLDTIVFDKTGTLTRGKPDVTDIVCAPGIAETELIQIAAAVEQNSEHPLGKAIVMYAKTLGLELHTVAQFSSTTGLGVEAVVDGKHVIAGRTSFIETAGIKTQSMQRQIEIAAASGASVVMVAWDGRIAGLIAIADPVKPDSDGAIAALQGLGIGTELVTGDHRTTALAVAATTGIEHVLAEAKPADKILEIQRLQSEGRRVGMVGDGINDAPALAQANVGFAIGTGSDIAIEAGDITVISNGVSAVVAAVQLGRATMATIRQNLTLAFAYNIVAIPVAAGVLYPFTGLQLSPMIAAGTMALSSLSVVTNSNRLRHFLPRISEKAVNPRVVADVRVASPTPLSSAKAVDPVCGMTVDPKTALSAVVNSQTIFFCCAGCREALLADPETFLAPAAVNR